MDWDAMIADLESSFDAERRADLVAQSAQAAGGGRRRPRGLGQGCEWVTGPSHRLLVRDVA